MSRFKSMRRTALLSAAAALLTGAAQAQTVATASAQEAMQVDEVVVTALRDRTNVQAAPAAVTAVSGEMLERQKVTDVRGLQNLAPSAKFSAANTSTRIYIRGVGSALDFYWIPETTAVNLNGTYVPRYATTGALFDIESVQILPGPQGVLYGRSAGGGAVVINSKRPVFDNQASGTFEYGNYDALRVEGMGNLKVNDALAVRAAVSIAKRDGYQSYNLQADDSMSVRLSALYKPTDRLSVFLWGTRFKQTGNPAAAQYLPYIAGHDAWYVPPVDPVTGASNTSGSYADYRYTIGGGELQYDLGPAQLTYTASALNQTEHSLRKLVGADQVLDNDQDQYTQDLRLSGDSGALSWIGGVNWFYARSNYDTRFGPHQFGNIFPVIRQKSLSGFFQGTWKVGDEVRLVAGGRYTRDSLELHGTGIACFATCSYPPIDFDDSWRHFDWKVGAEWDAAPGVLAYANVQSGYAPGTLNTYTNTVTVAKEIEPQTLVAYTAGLKTQTADKVLTVNLEAFYYDYKDLIIQAFNASLGQQTLYNAPKATVYGVQATTTLRPTTHDTLSANLAYTRGEYGHFVSGPGAIDLDGLQMVYTPTWTGTLAYDHRFDLDSGATLNLRASTYLSGAFWGTFDHTRGVRQGSYAKSDASLVYTAPDASWSASAWVKNIEDKAVNTALSSSGAAAPYAGAAFLEPPRTYGVTLGFKL